MGTTGPKSPRLNDWCLVRPVINRKGDPDENSINDGGAGGHVAGDIRCPTRSYGCREGGLQDSRKGQSRESRCAQDGGVPGLRREGGEEGARAGQGQPEVQGQDVLLLQPAG